MPTGNYADTFWAQLADPARAIQTFLTIGTSALIALNSFPVIRDRLFPYGARSSKSKPFREGNKVKDKDLSLKEAPGQDESLFAKAVGLIAGLQVPHRWFTHFYAVSVLSSMFWAYQIVTEGPSYRYLAENSTHTDINKSMTLQQVTLTWLLVLIQGMRRLYEHIVIFNPGSSKMSILQYLLGYTFYVPLGIAVWAEAIPTINTTEFSWRTLQSLFGPPSLRTFLCVPLFLIASGVQHDCHAYLASLKKYTLPSHPFFQQITCPHYTAEVAIYVALAFIAAPRGSYVNQTILAFLYFTAVALGVTANGTRQWYGQKFGTSSVAGRWRILPFIF